MSTEDDVDGAMSSRRSSARQQVTEPRGPVVESIENSTVNFYPLVVNRWSAVLVAGGTLLLAAVIAFAVRHDPDALAIWLALGVIVVGVEICCAFIIHRAFAPNWRMRINVDEATSLEALRAKVGRQWIKQGLERSLKGTLRLHVGLDGQPDAVASSGWSRTNLDVLRPPDRWPEGASLAALRADGNRRILLIGDPGSGKTTHLLEFAAEMNGTGEGGQNVAPVVLLLSFWSDAFATFAEWVIHELVLRYSVPPELAEKWLYSGRLVLLLDGLDEIQDLELRRSCGKALSVFARDPDLDVVEMVVTCRTDQYREMGQRLPFDAAAVVRPVSIEEVKNVVIAAGGRYSALRRAVESSRRIRELLSTPLMFGVLLLVSEGLEADVEIDADRVYDLFTARMLHRDRALGKDDRPMSRQHAKDLFFYLACLARLMHRRGQVIFYPDLLTPAWLPDRNWSERLPRARPASAVVARLLGWDHTSTGLVGAGYAAVIGALVAVPLGALLGDWRALLILSSLVSAVCAAMVFAVFGILFQSDAGERSLSLILYREEQTAYSAAAWTWSWLRAARGVAALLVPSFIVFGIGLALLTMAEAAAVAVILLFAGFLSGGSVPDHSRPPATAGAALAASTRRFFWLVMVLVAVDLPVAGGLALVGGPAAATIAALPLAIACTFVAGPGRAWLRRRAALFGVRNSGLLPRDLRRMLSEAESRTLMRKAGGGYMFLHRTYQDYLCLKDPEVLPDVPRPVG